MPDSGELPSSGSEGQEGSAGIPRSEHAHIRLGQGRPVKQVVNDVQRAVAHNVFVQVEDGRFVVRGARGREHILEPTGEHVTSVRRSEAAHQARLRDGVVRAATEEEFQKLKGFLT